MIGEKLSSLLESKKIKAGTLASLTGIPKSTIYSIIKRNNKNVDFSVIKKIADTLDVPVEYFYDRTEGKKERPVCESVNEQLDDIDEITEIFLQLTPDNRSKLLELSRLFLNDQRNKGG